LLVFVGVRRGDERETPDEFLTNEPPMALTDTAIRNLKPQQKPYKKSDSGGLQLHVIPEASELWRLAYRFAGKQKTIALGPYPVVTLAMAHEARDEAKRLLAQGVDPSEKRHHALHLRCRPSAAACCPNLPLVQARCDGHLEAPYLSVVNGFRNSVKRTGEWASKSVMSSSSNLAVHL
jgi:Arm DNA-binding domain